MNERKKRLRDNLVHSESISDIRKEQYEKELAMMFEHKLSAPRKWGSIFLVFVMLSQFAWFTWAAFMFRERNLLVSAGFVLGMVFSLFFAILLIRTLKKGSFNLRTDANAMTGAVWLFMVMFVVIMLFLAGGMEDKVAAVQMIAQTTIFFIMAVTFLLKNAVDQSELKTREKLLEIDYRLAEISEKLDK